MKEGVLLWQTLEHLKKTLVATATIWRLTREKSDYNREGTPHWHLCGKHGRIGSISIYGDWIETPDADRRIIKEAEELTSRYSSDIRDAYVLTGLAINAFATAR